MGTKHLFILAEDNLQSRLIEEQLSLIPNVNVKILLPEDVVFNCHYLNVDLVLMDYDFIPQLSVSDKIPDFDLLGWPLMVHNVPNQCVKTNILRWTLLKGVLLRNAPVTAIRDCVEHIFNGGLWLPRSYLEKLVNDYRCANSNRDSQHDMLTCRERQILALLVHGVSNQKIADHLFLSESTVKSHIYKLYKKLDVHSRHDAIKLARLNSGLTAQ